MSGVGEERETYPALLAAIQAYGRETYGSDYVVQDFVLIGFALSMGDDTDESEYLMASSTQAPHIVDGLVSQVSLFSGEGHSHDD